MIDSVFSGHSPVDANNALSLFILQALLIIGVARGFAACMRPLCIPRVVAEIAAGVALGPTLLGQLPGFTNALFPLKSLPGLKLVADLGLVFVVFLAALELDPAVRTAAIRSREVRSAAIAGLLLPLGLGSAAGLAIHSLLDLPGRGIVFVVFVGVALSITAFPVLARVLAERKLLHTTVGHVTISAAALNDVAAWSLLAIIIAVINNTNQIYALYSILAAAAWTLVLFFGAKPALYHFSTLSRHRDSVGTSVVVAIFMLILLSAWVTDVIGIHPIFGGFLAGLIVPRENAFAIKISEKMEDFVGVLFLPLYFAFSGLRTDLTQLDSGTVWGLFFLVLAVTCVGKVFGCAFAARISGMAWRESWAVGVLMNTKGLIELIALNLGLEVGIINNQVFALLVLVTLITTLMTTPLVALIYPPDKQRPMSKLEVNAVSDVLELNRHATAEDIENILTVHHSRMDLNLLVCVLDSAPMLSMIGLFQTLRAYFNRVKGPKWGDAKMEITALRLLRPSQRTSTLLNRFDTETTAHRDPVLQIFRAYASTHKLGVKSMVAISSPSEFADTIIKSAQKVNANCILVPWQSPDSQQRVFDYWFEDQNFSNSRNHKTSVASEVLEHAKCNVVILVDNGFGGAIENVASRQQADTSEVPDWDQEDAIRVLIPFFGGPDDREALMLGVRLAAHPKVIVKVLRIRSSRQLAEEELLDESFTNYAFKSSSEISLDRGDGGNAIDLGGRNSSDTINVTEINRTLNCQSGKEYAEDGEADLEIDLEVGLTQDSENPDPPCPPSPLLPPPAVTYTRLRREISVSSDLPQEGATVDGEDLLEKTDFEDERYLTHLREHITPYTPTEEVRPFIIPLERCTTDPNAGFLHRHHSRNSSKGSVLSWGTKMQRTSSLPQDMFSLRSSPVSNAPLEEGTKLSNIFKRGRTNSSPAAAMVHFHLPVVTPRSSMDDLSLSRAGNNSLNFHPEISFPEPVAMALHLSPLDDEQGIAPVSPSQPHISEDSTTAPNQKLHSPSCQFTGEPSWNNWPNSSPLYTNNGSGFGLVPDTTTINTINNTSTANTINNQSNSKGTRWERKRFNSAFSFLRRESLSSSEEYLSPQIKNIELIELETDRPLDVVQEEVKRFRPQDIVVVGLEGTGRASIVDIGNRPRLNSNREDFVLGELAGRLVTLSGCNPSLLVVKAKR